MSDYNMSESDYMEDKENYLRNDIHFFGSQEDGCISLGIFSTILNF